MSLWHTVVWRQWHTFQTIPGSHWGNCCFSLAAPEAFMANSVCNESGFPSPERRGWVALEQSGRAAEGCSSSDGMWSFVREAHNLCSWGRWREGEKMRAASQNARLGSQIWVLSEVRWEVCWNHRSWIMESKPRARTLRWTRGDADGTLWPLPSTLVTLPSLFPSSYAGGCGVRFLMSILTSSGGSVAWPGCITIAHVQACLEVGRWQLFHSPNEDLEARIPVPDSNTCL